MSEKEKNQYLDFGRIDRVYIKIINNDPNDFYHIYNPKTKKFYENEYKLVLDGIYVSGGKDNLVNEYFTEDYYIYPNHTINLNLNHPIDKIVVKCDDNNSLCHKINSDIGTFYPIKDTYTFQRNKNIVTEYHHGRILDFTCTDDISLFDKCLLGSMNLMIGEEFPSQSSYINENTINGSRISNLELIFDHKINIDNLNIFIETTYYNILCYDLQSKKEEFIFVT